MKKLSQQNTYKVAPHGKYEFKILNSILNDKKVIERRGCNNRIQKILLHSII